MYMFITEARPEKLRIDAKTWPQLVDGMIEAFSRSGSCRRFDPHLFAPEAAIDYRPLTNLLVPAPWNRGRVVLIGDTIAATTPHLASGAGIGIESGIVLGGGARRRRRACKTRSTVSMRGAGSVAAW